VLKAKQQPAPCFPTQTYTVVTGTFRVVVFLLPPASIWKLVRRSKASGRYKNV